MPATTDLSRLPRRILGLCLCLLLFSGASCATTRVALKSEPAPYGTDRLVIITADDFGASENINQGIRLAARAGVITAISAMTNFPESLAELEEISRESPQVGIGVHLNITTGKPVLPPEQIPSLVTDEGNFYTIEDIFPRLKKLSATELKSELRAQIELLPRRGIRVDHLSNQHGLLSLYSPFLEIVLQLAEEYQVPVRSCIAASVRYRDLFPKAGTRKKGLSVAAGFALRNPLRALAFAKYSTLKEMQKNESKMDSIGIPHPDLLLDYFYGDPTAANVIYILGNLPPGTSEIVLHLGTYQREDSYPSGLDLEYFRQREYELLTVTSEYLRSYFQYLNIKAIGYRDIPLNR
jgi:predicted glycoside hydrolase/deacetylase ChbG (UPF0249 family)